MINISCYMYFVGYNKLQVDDNYIDLQLKSGVDDNNRIILDQESIHIIYDNKNYIPVYHVMGLKNKNVFDLNIKTLM